MQTDTKFIRRIGALSRLELETDEVAAMAAEFGDIIAMVEKLSGVDVEGVEPFINAAGGDNVLRPDREAPSLERDRALANAPEQAGGFFRVPEVL